MMPGETGLIWGAALAVCALVVAGYLYAFRRRGRVERSRLAEARELGIDRPKGQFPYIDPSICIGCGGCVKACPEKDVLGLVGGLAMVVNGARCIGIGQCEKACPVGAIEIAVGDMKSRADVPLMDGHHQTNVRGLYVAGELGGLALVRNAVEQGRETVRRIGDELAASEEQLEEQLPELLDVAIVGAGPAGLSAALSAAERGLRYAVFEQAEDLGGTIFNYPRRKLTHTQPVELPLHGKLTKDQYTKEELLELFSGLVDRHRLEIRFGHRVLGVAGDGDSGFEVNTSGGASRARRVVLAMGRRGTPRKLGVPGEELPKVMYQVRDAEEYRGCRILVVGGGDSAVEAAMGLARQPGNEVAISYRKAGFFRLKKKNQDRLEKMLARRRLRPIYQSQVRQIAEDSVRLEVAGGDAEGEDLVLANDYVFVMIGGLPPFPFLREAGVRFGGEEADQSPPGSPMPPRAAGPPATGSATA